MDDPEAAWAEPRAVNAAGWFVELLAIGVLGVGCGAAPISSADQGTAPPDVVASRPNVPAVGMRQLIINVANTGPLPAVLHVGKDESFPRNVAVGNASPSSVPGHASMRVVFTVPLTDDWAIFVNPAPERGATMSARELARCVGFVPVEITVDGRGEGGTRFPREPTCVM